MAELMDHPGQIEDAAVQRLKSVLDGSLLSHGDEGYGEARRVWNWLIDKHPGLIVRCAGNADAIRAVEFAREHDLLVAVRGGGHGIAGDATCDGGMVIDLSPMKAIDMDPGGRTVRAQGGVTWREFDHETQAFGLATTGGTDPSTGIAGLTVGGGEGWLMGKYGLACDNLLSVDVVTADGRVLTASPTEHQDLFWGVRGGGGNFGIVTSFQYCLYPVGRLLAGTVAYPFARAREVLRRYRDFVHTQPDELVTWPVLGAPPEGDMVVVILACYHGDLAEGERVLKPLRTLGTPVLDSIGPKSYLEVQGMFEVRQGEQSQNYWKANYLRDLSDEAIDVILEYLGAKPSARCGVLLEYWHGAAARVRPEETAFAHRGDRYGIGIIAKWFDPLASEEHIRWAREFWTAMEPHSSRGVYVNYLGDEGEERVKAAYTPETYERLVALKKKYDPTNFFRLNRNIKPTA